MTDLDTLLFPPDRHSAQIGSLEPFSYWLVSDSWCMLASTSEVINFISIFLRNDLKIFYEEKDVDNTGCFSGSRFWWGLVLLSKPVAERSASVRSPYRLAKRANVYGS